MSQEPLEFDDLSAETAAPDTVAAQECTDEEALSEPLAYAAEPDETEVPEAADESVDEAPKRRRRQRGVLFGLGALLVLSLVVVLVLRALSFEAHWENGRLVVSFFGADSPYVEDAVTGAATPTQPTPETTLARAPTGTGVTLTITARPDRALTLQEIYRSVSPSTVSILTYADDGSEYGTGSGIIMTADGYVLTNHHVINGASTVSVETAGGDAYEAQLVGSDEFSDLAVLKLDATGLPTARFGSSDGLQVGDRVVAIGDPLGVELRGTMTDGIISAINRDIVVEERVMTLLQTNAALNAGNSGGPLIDLYGQVIGINTMKISSSYVSVEGLGFAIPMDVARPLVDELIAQGFVAGRPALGITGTAVEAESSVFYQIPAGVYVNSVEPNSDAARQGLQEGDIIVAIEGETVTTLEELNTVKNRYRAGDTVRLTIWRDGESLDLGVTLIDRAQ